MFSAAHTAAQACCGIARFILRCLNRSMLRILSDLHLRDASTRIRRLEDLAPLLEGVDELWLNGDTCDNQSGMTPAELARIQTFFTARVPRVRFITGNHDPDISDCHEASAADGLLWATHGDVFLDSVVPWSRVRDQLEARVRDQLARDPNLDFTSFDGRVTAMRRACTGFRRECDPERKDPSHRFRRLLMEFFPPRQPMAMVHTWWTFPARVVEAARRWRPAAHIIVTGHVHFPRTWRHADKIVINTGAFSGPVGARAVDVHSDRVEVRRIENHPDGWRTTRVLATIPLAKG